MKKLAIILLAFTLFSCVTKIESLKSNPTKYVGEVVSLKGTVSKYIKIPLTDYAFFELKDTTGNIIVFSMSKYNKNQNVTLKAKVVGYDSTNQEKSSKVVIEAVEDFLIDNTKMESKKIKDSSKKIGGVLSKALNGMNATYFLIEQE